MTVDLTKALEIPVTSSMFVHDLQKIAELAENCERIVELGSYWGRSTRAILDSSIAQIWCIDSWNLSRDRHEQGVGDVDLRKFLDNLQDVRDRIVILRMLTIEAVGLLPEGCFDMVVIDADHSYEAVRFDILHYASLLREGGILCGHDYRPGEEVAWAVDELLVAPHVLHKGVVWWAEKKEGWLREEPGTHRAALYYTTGSCYEITSD